VPFEFAIAHAFSSVSIRAHAPAASGVYGISNARRWIYIGETDNIRERLLEHLGESTTGIKAQVPTGFTYEACDWNLRTERHDRLVAEFKPICNGERARRRKGNQ
jgi:hypothetical protein